MKKKYRIKSKVRFTSFILVAVLLIAGIVNAGFGSYEVSGTTIDDYVVVEVSDGDTLWDLANYYLPDLDTRKAVYIIKKTNGITSDLHEGQELKIPVYE